MPGSHVDGIDPAPPAELAVDAPGAVRLARNSVLSLFRGVVTAPLALLSTAVLLARLGPSAVGIYGMLGFLVNPIVTFDFGLTMALTRQVPFRRERPGALGELVASGLALYLSVVTALALVHLSGRTPAADWLAARSGFPADTVRLALDLAAATYAVLLIGLAHSAALNGLERIPENLQAITVNQVLLTALILLAVDGPAGLPRLFACTLIAALVQVWMQVTAANRAIGARVVSPLGATWTSMRSLLAEGGLLSGLAAFRVGFLYLDKWLLASVLGATSAGYYELGSRLGVVLRAVLNTIAAPLLSSSAVAAASALADAKLTRLSFYSLRYLMAISVPVLAVTTMQASALCRIWIGNTPPDAVLALMALVPSHLLNAWAWSILYQMVGEGLIPGAVAAGGIAVLVNLGLDLLALSGGLGFPGVLGANLVTSAALVGSLVTNQVRRGRLVSGRLLGTSLRLAAAGIAATVVVHGLPVIVPADTRWLAALDLSVRLVACGVVYAGFLWLTGEVDDQDRYFLRTLGGLRQARTEPSISGP